MRIQARDLSILNIIGENYFVTREYISEMFKMSLDYTYKRLKKYVDNGYLNQAVRPFAYCYDKDVFYLTDSGYKLIHGKYKDNGLRIKNAEHTFGLLQIELELIHEFGPQIKEIEREKLIAHELSKKTVKRSDFYALAKYEADIYLYLENGDKIAIEFERTLKEKNRIKEKVRHYEEQLISKDLSKVIYYVTDNSIYNAVNSFQVYDTDVEIRGCNYE